ncbi:MAG TPA: hypothetical protein DCP92_21690 [Nitrospiraceae bacterium]|nr:hypothetical protein [Nitrospiraceae bacterium]
MPWTMNVNPFGYLTVSTLNAAVRILFIFLALAVLRMKGHRTAIVAPAIRSVFSTRSSFFLKCWSRVAGRCLNVGAYPLKEYSCAGDAGKFDRLWREKTVLLQLKKNRFLLKPLIVLMLLIVPRLTYAAAPMEVIQTKTDKVLAILHQSKSGPSRPVGEREGEILDVVSSYFNLDEMAKRALGHPWEQQSPENRQEFARLFKKLLFNTYVDRMEKYHDERVFYDNQKLDDDFAVVKTHFLSRNDNISIDYKLHNEQGQWKVYDVVVEGISYVDNYRDQIASILANQSFDSLLNLLRQKVERAG